MSCRRQLRALHRIALYREKETGNRVQVTYRGAFGYVTGVPSTGTVKLTLNKAAGTASAPKTAVVAWFVVN